MVTLEEVFMQEWGVGARDQPFFLLEIFHPLKSMLKFWHLLSFNGGYKSEAMYGFSIKLLFSCDRKGVDKADDGWCFHASFGCVWNRILH